MERIIKSILDDANKQGIKNPVHYYLHGGCYKFGLLLRDEMSRQCGIDKVGELIYLLQEHHFVFRYNNKLYDATGNVTRAYKDNKFISEEEFLHRDKLRKGIKIQK